MYVLDNLQYVNAISLFFITFLSSFCISISLPLTVCTRILGGSNFCKKKKECAYPAMLIKIVEYKLTAYNLIIVFALHLAPYRYICICMYMFNAFINSNHIIHRVEIINKINIVCFVLIFWDKSERSTWCKIN